jgi:hypothetical protein|tara:strand:- start:369 stop:506 length:138 start_codon:yes stop_codon:yes gene_type:complete
MPWNDPMSFKERSGFPGFFEIAVGVDDVVVEALINIHAGRLSLNG